MLTAALRADLEKTNAQFGRWVNAQRDWLATTDADARRVAEEAESTAQALAETDRQLEASRPLNEAIKTSQRRDVDQVVAQTESQRRQCRQLEQSLAEATIEEERSIKALQIARQEHDAKKSKLEQALNDLTHGTKFFSQLGLEFQKAEGDRMRFVFTQLDRTQPHRAASFLLFVDANNEYQLLDTAPVLPPSALFALVRELNASNDIAAFVFQVRKLFRAAFSP